MVVVEDYSIMAMEITINTNRMNTWIDSKKKLFYYRKKFRHRNVGLKSTRKLILKVGKRLKKSKS